MARARRRHAVERGHVAQRQPNQAGGSQNTGGAAEARTSGVQQDVASGAAGGFIGRQPVAADGEWLRSVTPTARHALLPPCRRVTNLN
jgi:hypothetical protein